MIIDRNPFNGIESYQGISLELGERCKSRIRSMELKGYFEKLGIKRFEDYMLNPFNGIES